MGENSRFRLFFLREASRENKVWITLGMFCTECAEKNYVFHKRKKRMGKIVDNGKENPVFVYRSRRMGNTAYCRKAGGEREIEKRL